MKMNFFVSKPLKPKIGQTDREAISKAVAQAEKHTSGEIVPMIVLSSTSMGHVKPILVLIGLCILLSLIPFLQANWTLALLTMAVLVQGLSRFHFIQRFLTAYTDMRRQVRMRAELEFFENGLEKTKDHTGVLIFISLMERQAVILADKNIARKVPPEIWSVVCKDLIQGLRKNNIGAGFVAAIQRCQEILAPHFPPDLTPKNELPDRVVIKH